MASSAGHQVARQIDLGLVLGDRRMRRVAEVAVANRPENCRADVGMARDFRPTLRDRNPLEALGQFDRRFSAPRSRPQSVEHTPKEPEVQHPGPQRLIGLRPGVQDRRAPTSASGHGSRKRRRLAAQYSAMNQ